MKFIENFPLMELIFCLMVSSHFIETTINTVYLSRMNFYMRCT